MIRPSPLVLTAVLLAGTMLPGAGLASSEDAWEEMRADVREKCLQAVADTVEAPKAVIDPFGSERFGLALISGRAKGADVEITHICVYDKQAKTVEIGSELTEAIMGGGVPEEKPD